jgi:hypothetical protein
MSVILPRPKGSSSAAGTGSIRYQNHMPRVPPNSTPPVMSSHPIRPIASDGSYKMLTATRASDTSPPGTIRKKRW